MRRLRGVLPNWRINSPLCSLKMLNSLPSMYILNLDTVTNTANVASSEIAYLISAGINFWLVKLTRKYCSSNSWQRQKEIAKLEEYVNKTNWRASLATVRMTYYSMLSVSVLMCRRVLSLCTWHPSWLLCSPNVIK